MPWGPQPWRTSDHRPSHGPYRRARGVRVRLKPASPSTRLAVLFGVVLLLVTTGTVVGGRYLLSRYSRGLHVESLLGDAAATDANGNGSIRGPINVLLVGLDERPAGNSDGVRADSMIIVHVTADHGRAYLISVPRDALVRIPAFQKTGYPGGEDKVNAAFQYGALNGGGRAAGFELLAMTVKQFTGIAFNGGAIVNFAGFQSLVTALGGIDLCVDETVVSVHIGRDAEGRPGVPYELTDGGPVPIPGVTPQVYHPGCQHMAAWQALDYVRQRELIPDGDYGRQRHQQQFLQAVLKKASSGGLLSNAVKLDAVVRTAGPALTFDPGGVSIARWLLALKDVRADKTVLLRTNGGVFNTADVNGESTEVLSDDSMTLFEEVRRDQVGRFVTSHPDWVVGTDGP
jgi:LCP family protein required for cell wall assembly